MPEHQQIQQSKKTNTIFQNQATPISQTPVSNTFSIIQRAKINPKSLTYADVMQLQHIIGNRAVGRLLSGIGYTSTAQQVIVQRQEIHGEETCPSCMQRKEILEEEEPLQGKMSETVQRQEIPEEEEPLQGRMADTIQRQEIPEEELLQGKMIETIQLQELYVPRIESKNRVFGISSRLSQKANRLEGDYPVIIQGCFRCGDPLCKEGEKCLKSYSLKLPWQEPEYTPCKEGDSCHHKKVYKPGELCPLPMAEPLDDKQRLWLLASMKQELGQSQSTGAGFCERAALAAAKAKEDPRNASRLANYAEGIIHTVIPERTISDIEIADTARSPSIEQQSAVSASSSTGDTDGVDSAMEADKDWVMISPVTVFGTTLSGRTGKPDSDRGPYSTANTDCADPQIQDRVYEWQKKQRQRLSQSVHSPEREYGMFVDLYDEKDPCPTCDFNLRQQSIREKIQIDVFKPPISEYEEHRKHGEELMTEPYSRFKRPRLRGRRANVVKSHRTTYHPEGIEEPLRTRHGVSRKEIIEWNKAHRRLLKKPILNKQKQIESIKSNIRELLERLRETQDDTMVKSINEKIEKLQLIIGDLNSLMVKDIEKWTAFSSKIQEIKNWPPLSPKDTD